MALNKAKTVIRCTYRGLHRAQGGRRRRRSHQPKTDTVLQRRAEGWLTAFLLSGHNIVTAIHVPQLDTLRTQR